MTYKILRAAAVLAASLSAVAGAALPTMSARGAFLARDGSGPLVHFPADQAGHAGVQDEWWYVVGHLHSGRRTFGYETTIFKFHNLRPPGFSTGISLYRTDVAITDERAHRFLQRVTYYFPESARVSLTSLAVRVGTASLAGRPGAMKLSAAEPGGRISLQLSSRRPPMYVGGRGYLSFSSGYTYYYSLTRLATTGSLTVAGRVYRVSGMSWLDHQWGTWAWTSTRGWTWMALQLDNGVQLSVADVRSASPVRGASVLLANGKIHTIRNVSITATGRWHSRHTGGRYPSGWIVRIPALRAVMRVVPTVKDQELTVPHQPFGSYWEGSGRLSGTFGGKPVTGLTYTELTGFARH